ncbi:MAG: PAS domain-containing protein [Parvibaculum sp.]|uniref:PAS domain-containing protein n=1 Tax=Parvibaculum sp. TaxID=2024848 RepID=UPI0025E5B7D5|nr:PAS domain-containing protein [Parvibaculum sp.]MCE9651361.1 PAS domain-containing protein [Parvibaculum sp.]
MIDASLHSAGGRRLFEYWQELPKRGLLPDVSGFDPSGIPLLLPTVTLIEVISFERLEFRWVGTGVVEAIGFDPTGQNYLDMQTDEAKALYLRLVEAQIGLPCGRQNILRMRHSDGVITRVEAVTLPMRDASSGHSLILSYFGTLDVVGFGEGGYKVLDFENTKWIDIGAGVPDWR